eukprot:jgi/Tetstr1/457896/TSEL_044415.t1
MSSLRFCREPVAAGVDPFCRSGARSLLHIAREQTRPAARLARWSMPSACRRLSSCSSAWISQGSAAAGGRPWRGALEGPAFDRLLDLEARLLDPAGGEEAAWVVQQLERNRCMERAMEDYQRTEIYRQSEIAATVYAAGIKRAREGGDDVSAVSLGAERAAPGMGEHVLRRFVDDQVVRHGCTDVLRWMWLELDRQRWAHCPKPAGPSFASRDAGAWQRHVAARRAIGAAPPGEPNVSSCHELWDCQLCRADVRESEEDTLDGGGAAIDGTSLAILLAIRCGDSVLGCRHHHSVELTIGQSILASGGWLGSCWPWLVEERGVDIQASAVADEAARMLLCFSPGKQDVLEAMRQAQRRRFALAAILVKGGFPVGGGAPAEELRSVDLRTLHDRAGRPVLTAAIAEQRPREVLASLAEALKRQGGQRQGVAPAGTGRRQPLLRQRHLLTKALAIVTTSQHHSDLPNL